MKRRFDVAAVTRPTLLLLLCRCAAAALATLLVAACVYLIAAAACMSVDDRMARRRQWAMADESGARLVRLRISRPAIVCRPSPFATPLQPATQRALNDSNNRYTA